LNDKKILFFVCFFIAGVVLGLVLGNLGTGILGNRELRKRLEQVNRDLRTAIESQREAAERASGLQTELQRVRDHAGNIEAGTGRLEARTGSLAEQLDGIAHRSGELSDGINRASDSLEKSRVLLDELGVIVRSLPGSFGKED